MRSSVSLFLDDSFEPSVATLPVRPAEVKPKAEPEPLPPDEPKIIEEFEVQSSEHHALIGKMIIVGNGYSYSATFIPANAQSIKDRVSRITGGKDYTRLRDAVLREVRGYRAYSIPQETLMR